MNGCDIVILLSEYPEILNKTSICKWEGLKKCLDFSKFVFLNTEHNILPHQHWIVFLKHKKRKEIEIFDPLGKVSNVVIKALKYKYQLKINKKKSQPMGTNTCGVLCVYFILKRTQLHKIKFFNFIATVFSNTYSKLIRHIWQRVKNGRFLRRSL
jgi:hypothetical protein